MEPRAKKQGDRAGLRAKVVQVRVNDGTTIGQELENAINSFLGEVPEAEIANTQLHMIDIGGPSQADIIVLCTIFYTT